MHQCNIHLSKWCRLSAWKKEKKHLISSKVYEKLSWHFYIHLLYSLDYLSIITFLLMSISLANSALQTTSSDFKNHQERVRGAKEHNTWRTWQSSLQIEYLFSESRTLPNKSQHAKKIFTAHGSGDSKKWVLKQSDFVIHKNSIIFS